MACVRSIDASSTCAAIDVIDDMRCDRRFPDDVRDRAEKATGYRFDDVGEAAAALGIHAYQVPQQGEDFFVILNRGAVVAAMDSQLSDEN